MLQYLSRKIKFCRPFLFPRIFIAVVPISCASFIHETLCQMPVSSGPTLLTRVRAASTSAWNNFRNAPVSEKQDMEQQWGAAITTTRLDDSDRSSEMVGMHNPIASVRGSESSNLRASEVEARASVYDSYAGRASWVQWDISEPTLAEEAERVQAEESFADAPRPV
jgi:hypothetical protein